MNTITKTQYKFPKQKSVYEGKVRDVYTLENDLLIMISTDRISAFDTILPKGIPYKGQVLNQMASHFMKQTEDIIPNWILDTPDPNVSIGIACTPIKIEMVIRGYLSGHAAREYAQGKHQICGVPLPKGLRENDKLPTPIITPSIKADKDAHDQDISKENILRQHLVGYEDYLQMEKYTYALFQRGTEIASKRGLILVDTKYEFGKTRDGKILLIDEIHTPDSSRYFYNEDYLENQGEGKPQRQLSKEFVRQWLIKNGFQGKKGQTIPIMTTNYIDVVSKKYIELYERLLGKKFVKSATSDITRRVERRLNDYLNSASKRI